MSNKGVEPGQVWELRQQQGIGRSILLLVTQLEGGEFGSLIGVSLEDGRVTSLFQTTMGRLEEQGCVTRIA